MRAGQRELTKGTGESDQYSTDVAGIVSQVLFRHDFDAILSVMFGTISGMNSRFERAVGILQLRNDRFHTARGQS